MSQKSKSVPRVRKRYMHVVRDLFVLCLSVPGRCGSRRKSITSNVYDNALLCSIFIMERSCAEALYDALWLCLLCIYSLVCSNPVLPPSLPSPPPLQEPPRLSTSGASQPTTWQSLRFDDVYYRYPGATKDAVSKVMFEIRRGESVALVGRSGAGKTTIVDLVLGLLTPTAGQISLDDASLAGTYGDGLVMGYVPQPSYLLDESVRRNVAFGVEEAEIDDQRVSESLDWVQMREVVEAMDGQLASRMGRDGVRMSGGQRQRLGIARALFDDPEILVLDEATSALDNETERDVSEAIMALAGQRTLLIVAHRLNTVKRCDKVLFFDSGQLVADGDYDTLSVQCAPFRRLIEAGEI